MNDTILPASGQTQIDGSANLESKVGEDVPKPKKDTVAYDTYSRVLGEKKKAAERAQALESELEGLKLKDKQREETELAEREEWKKIADLKAGELAKRDEELNALRSQQTNAVKLQGFMNSLDGNVDQKYWNHIDLNAIAVDPETGNVDEMSVTKEVERFKSEHGVLVQTTKAKGLPNQAPQVSSKDLGVNRTLREQRDDLGSLISKI